MALIVKATECAIAFIIAMFLLQWLTLLLVREFVRMGVALPTFLRVLLNVAAYWYHYWPAASFLAIVFAIATASFVHALVNAKRPSR